MTMVVTAGVIVAGVSTNCSFVLFPVYPPSLSPPAHSARVCVRVCGCVCAGSESGSQTPSAGHPARERIDGDQQSGLLWCVSHQATADGARDLWLTPGRKDFWTFPRQRGLCNDSTALASLTLPLASRDSLPSEIPPTALFRGFPFSGRTK